jgi:thiamine-phosphate pyrophosphorylase
MTLDMRLYALIDPEHSGGHDIVELARQVAQGGATIVQLRDKRGTTRAMVEQAGRIKAVLAPLQLPFVINDRVDVALASGADGVHLGQYDMSALNARTLLGSEAIIGLTIRTAEEADAAPFDLVDYVGVGGVFATASKEASASPIGLAGLMRIAEVVRRRAPKLPVCAIAGITIGNASQTIAAGVDGVAVISALSSERNPQAAACRMRCLIEAALVRRKSA